MTEFPAVNLNEQELENCLAVMRKGNKHLKALAEMTGMKQREFRAKLFKRPFDKADWSGLEEAQVATFVAALPHIQAVRNIECKMLAAFTPMARKHAHSWARRMSCTTADYEDFYQEALMALLDSIYGYTEETSFVNFAWHAITRRLYTAANKANPLTPLTNQAIKLIKLYKQTSASFNGNDDEVYTKMNLTDKELAVLKDARVRVFNASKMNDYTKARSIDKERDTVPYYYELYEAIERAGLTELERKVVLTSMYPHYGWQTELAKTTYNPRTKKPYTKMTISNILHGALAKIRAAYTPKEVA